MCLPQEFSRVKFSADLCKSPLGETVNRGLLCVPACKKITYTCQKSCSPCQSSVDYGHTKITQHELTEWESSKCWRWALCRWRRQRRCLTLAALSALSFSISSLTLCLQIRQPKTTSEVEKQFLNLKKLEARWQLDLAGVKRSIEDLGKSDSAE